MVIGGIIAGIMGFLIGIPVLRLSGDYLAIVTLAFGEIIKNIINCLYVGIDKSGLHVNMKDAASLGMKNGRIILNGRCRHNKNCHLYGRLCAYSFHPVCGN